MIVRKTILIALSFAFALSVTACGKKPRNVKSPDETSSFPTKYPTSR